MEAWSFTSLTGQPQNEHKVCMKGNGQWDRPLRREHNFQMSCSCRRLDRMWDWFGLQVLNAFSMRLTLLRDCDVLIS